MPNLVRFGPLSRLSKSIKMGACRALDSVGSLERLRSACVCKWAGWKSMSNDAVLTHPGMFGR